MNILWVALTYLVVVINGLYLGYEARASWRWRVAPEKTRRIVRGALLGGLSVMVLIYVVGFGINGFWGLAAAPVLGVVVGYVVTTKVAKSHQL